MLDTVLFEFDGILVDTGEARQDAVCAALLTEGINITGADYREWCAGHAFEEATRAVLAAHQRRDDETLVALVASRAERALRLTVVRTPME